MVEKESTTFQQEQPAYRLSGSPTTGLVMGTWGFFVGFAAVALYGPAAKYFPGADAIERARPRAAGGSPAADRLVACAFRSAPGWTGSAVACQCSRCSRMSLVGMWGLVFILLTAKTLTASAYPIIIMFGFLSGCGVASFSVGIPQVSYWYPQSRQGTVLGTYGGIGNLAPGLFTLLLPFAIAAWGLTGSYFAWFTFLLIGTAIYAWLARDAY